MVSNELIRRRAIQAVTFIAVLFFMPMAASSLCPAYADFVPPSLLLLTMTMSAFSALLAWKTAWLLKVMFGADYEADDAFRSVSRRRSYVICAAISILVSLGLLVLWLRNVL